MKTTNTTRRSRRRGISLIEVLMSIFIISIGIMGVAVLIPLAHYLANRGATADRAAAAGLAGLNSFKVLGLENPQTWRQPAGALMLLAPADTGANAPFEIAGSKKYCLDARGVARGLTANFPNGGTVTMPRLTLNSGIGPTAAGNIMQTPQADQTFSIHDDLVFTVNDNDPTAAPAQTLEGSGDKRFAARDFSWLATLVRELPGNQYTLSVAVVQGRNGINATEMGNLEAELNVNAMPGGGIGGGDVTVSIPGSPSAAQTAIFTGLVPGQWLMLTHAERARWYRIVAVSEVNGSSRDVTLAGRDWDPTGAYGAPKAAVLTNVIGVYVRTVRLKSDSMWQP